MSELDQVEFTDSSGNLIEPIKKGKQVNKSELSKTNVKKNKDNANQKRIKVVDGNELLKELIMKQLKNVPQDKKLQYTDLKRICKYIGSSIFDENKCCIWNGYITNANNSNKGTYVNFYFRKKKAALHRLLYCNFVGELYDDEYLKFSCECKGKCCTIKHLRKFQYQKKDEIDNEEPKTNLTQNITHNKAIKIICNASSVDLDKLYISFD